MDSILTTVIWIAAAILGLVGFFAVIRLFTINETLKQIRNELLIYRQERQADKADAAHGS